MLRLLSTVRLKDLTPQMVMVALVVDGVYSSFGVNEVYVTSANDRVHSTGSLHYKGRALDFRTQNVLGPIRPIIVQKIREFCPDPDFDVLWEDVGTPNEHLHIEYDPN